MRAKAIRGDISNKNTRDINYFRRYDAISNDVDDTELYIINYNVY
jgi:hypothetical protein